VGVTIEQVIWAYRILLDREVENLDTIRSHLSAEDVRTLRGMFLTSAEYLSQTGQTSQPVLAASEAADGALRIGRFLDVDKLEVQVEASQDELRAMLSRIAGNWRKFGQEDPHWSVLVDDAYRSDTIQDNLDQFYTTGHQVVQLLGSMLGRAGMPNRRFRKLMDYGCGVGRLTLSLASIAGEAIGVDISPQHLSFADAHAKKIGVNNVTFESIEEVDDLDRYRDFDCIVSAIVLQHNPPPVMAAIFRRLLNALASGGIALIQIPTFIDGYSFSVSSYLSSPEVDMEMNMLPPRHIFASIAQAGCSVLEVREDAAIGPMGVSHTFLIEKA
jgi:2-polyprenyl-3-methyl-5-hydroxy-6-metoxy-1,4-benzoquinol methylase